MNYIYQGLCHRESGRGQRCANLTSGPSASSRVGSQPSENGANLTRILLVVYTYIMRGEASEPASAAGLFDLPCACQNLRRATRIVTRMYDQELKKAGLEITQFGLLMALAATGEVNQKRLSGGFVMDSTTLTRTLDRMQKRGWISVQPGADKREHLFSLTAAGKRQIAKAEPLCSAKIRAY